MALNNFRLNIVLRIVLLVVFIGCFMFSLEHTGWIITRTILVLAVIIVVCDMVRYVERTNREFTNFILAIKSSDFSKHNMIDKRGRSFSGFKNALNIIIGEFQRARIDREANYIFLQTVVGHLNTAIISFDEKGDVKLMNEAAKALLHLPYLKNIYSLQQIDPALGSYLTGLQPSGNPTLEISIKGEKLHLSARSTDFNIQGNRHRLVSVQNIRTEIENTELEAWEQLLHVLTHEIMNSITPISSLSATLRKKAGTLLEHRKFDREEMTDLSDGLKVIEKRSIGLINFVNHYKSLITLPVPAFRILPVNDLFQNIIKLKTDGLKAKDIELKVHLKDPSLFVRSDPALAEQVLLNLVNNAIDALEGCTDPLIELSADVNGNRTVIRVSDNGAGIDREVIDKIFVPFFTTRNTGSGIGLSLSKQIMRIHSGSITVHSLPGKGSVFSLDFP